MRGMRTSVLWRQPTPVRSFRKRNQHWLRLETEDTKRRSANNRRTYTLIGTSCRIGFGILAMGSALLCLKEDMPMGLLFSLGSLGIGELLAYATRIEIAMTQSEILRAQLLEGSFAEDRARLIVDGFRNQPDGMVRFYLAPPEQIPLLSQQLQTALNFK